jgi:hypothetical protein
MTLQRRINMFTGINLQNVNVEILTWVGTFKGYKGVSEDEIPVN